MFKRYARIKKTLLTSSLALALSGCGHEVAGVLAPKGVIAFEERELLFDSLALMMIVVLPVIIMSFAFLYRYHHRKDQSDYRPNWSHNTLLESIWWGVPIAIIFIIATMTWTTTHTLDPYQKIDPNAETLQIEVVALPWKWLFIYPAQNIATVNLLEIPRGRQVEFLLTTDNVPMSSFFVPQLGSQIYAMAGMQTRLYLLGTETGTFRGLNTQYNGAGFSDMYFDTKVVEVEEFDAWVKATHAASEPLSTERYRQLREPTIAQPVLTFSNAEPHLFHTIIMSYGMSHHPH